MKALKILFLLPLSMLSFKMTAQIDDLLKNKDITWVAEVMSDYVVDDPDRAMERKPNNSIRTLKLMPKPDGNDEDDRTMFENLISDAIFQKEVPIFEDSLLQKKARLNNLLGGVGDTIVSIDSLTGDVKYSVIICSRMNFEKYQSFRVRQIVFYNARKAQFGLCTLAFAPMVYERSENGEIRDSIPYIWLSAQTLTKKPKLSSEEIVWARLLYIRQGFEIAKMKILKQSNKEMPIKHLLSVFVRNKKIPFYKTDELQKGNKIPYIERMKILSPPDTILQINPITYEEEVKVPYNRFNPDDIKFLRFVQEWYWDYSKYQLLIRLHSVAPMRDKTTINEEYLYSEPLFYRRTDD